MKSLNELSLEEIRDLGYFDFFARLGDSVMHPGGPDTTLEVLKNVRLTKNGEILEIGCGPGITTSLLLKAGYNVTACDVNPNMVEAAKKACQEVGYIFFQPYIASAESLPFKDNSFELVLLEAVFGFIENIDKALEEIERVLKPGGFVALVDMHYTTDPPRDVIKAIGKIVGREIPVYKEQDWYKIFQSFIQVHWRAYTYPTNTYGIIREDILLNRLKKHITSPEKEKEIFPIIVDKFQQYESVFSENRKYLKYHVGIWKKDSYERT